MMMLLLMLLLLMLLLLLLLILSSFVPFVSLCRSCLPSRADSRRRQRARRGAPRLKAVEVGAARPLLADIIGAACDCQRFAADAANRFFRRALGKFVCGTTAKPKRTTREMGGATLRRRPPSPSPSWMETPPSSCRLCGLSASSRGPWETTQGTTSRPSSSQFAADQLFPASAKHWPPVSAWIQ